MGGSNRTLVFEEKLPSLDAIQKMARERCALQIEVMPSLGGKKGEYVFFSEEIWQAVAITLDEERREVKFRWRNGFQGREYLRLVVVKCLIDLGGMGEPERSFSRKELFKTIAHAPYKKARKLVIPRLLGRFSLQVDSRFWKLDEALQRLRSAS